MATKMEMRYEINHCIMLQNSKTLQVSCQCNFGSDYERKSPNAFYLMVKLLQIKFDPFCLHQSCPPRLLLQHDQLLAYHLCIYCNFILKWPQIHNYANVTTMIGLPAYFPED